jgi:hypothetical protein
MLSLPLLPWVTARVDAEGVKVKLAGALTVRAMVVLDVSVPEIPVMVTAAAPMVAVLLAVNVSTLVPVVGFVPNAAVTPPGSPEAARATLPVNGLTSITVMVSVALLPGLIDSVLADGFSVKLPPVVTVRAMVVVLLIVPEVPVMVTEDVPTVAVALAVNVIALVVVAGLRENVADMPAGRPLAARVTLPLNGLTSVIVMVTVQLPPCGIVQGLPEVASEKLPVDGTTVREMLVVAVSVPEVPVMVTGYVPAAAVALTVNVRMLVAVAGLVPNAALTPAGRPDAARVTLPVNGLTSVTVIVAVPLAPWAIERVLAEGLRVKLPVAAPPQVVPLIAKETGTALVTPFQVPLNPIPERLPPAGTLPLYGSFVTVTFAPLWASTPFHSCETV